MTLLRGSAHLPLLVTLLLPACASSRAVVAENETPAGQSDPGEKEQTKSVRVARAENVGRTLFRLHKGARVAWTALSKKVGPVHESDHQIYLPSLVVEDGVFVKKVSVGFFTPNGKEAHRLTIHLGKKQIDFEHYEPPREAHPKAAILLEARKTALEKVERSQPVEPIMFFDPEGRPVVYLMAADTDSEKKSRHDVAVLGQHFEVVASNDGKAIASVRANTKSPDVRSLFEQDGQRSEFFDLAASKRSTPSEFDVYAALMWNTPIHVATSETNWTVTPSGKIEHRSR